MLCAGRTIHGCNPAEKCCVPKTSTPTKPTDQEVVEGAFKAHLKGNPKLKFPDGHKTTTATATNGKPKTDLGWEQYTYDVEKVGKNEFVLRYDRTYYDQRYKSMRFPQNENAYFMIKVTRNANGTQKYQVTKYKGFYRNKQRAFSFSSDTKAGRALIPPAPRTIAATTRSAQPSKFSFDKNRRRCSAKDSFTGGTAFLKRSLLTRTFKGATQGSDGQVYRFKATYISGQKRYVVTHSQKGAETWVQHFRNRPASARAVQAFFHACENYLVKE